MSIVNCPASNALRSNASRQILNQKGFSFIEVVIAVFVMLVGIVAVISLISTDIIHSADSRDTIIAAELAQEGVELVRNVRDNNFAKGYIGFYFPYFPATNNDYTNCRISKDSTVIDDCSGALTRFLYYISGFYDHNTAGSQTKFQRKIAIDYDTAEADPANEKQATIKSIVIWGSAWPTPPNYSDCTIGNKCVMTDVVLGNR